MRNFFFLILTFCVLITNAQNNPPTFSSSSDVTNNTISNGEIVNYVLPSISDDIFGNNIAFEAYPPTPSGFTRVGVLNGHTYFISNNNSTYASHLSSISTVPAAHPVSINSADENEFLRSYLASNGISVALIGFNDIASETNFVWQNGDPVTYTNWRFNAPSHTTSNHDVVEMQFDNGTWNDVSTALQRRIFIELPYAAEQIDGLPSGSNFPLGVTVNRFKATDDVGNVTTTSFNVVINDVQDPVISCPSNITTPVTTNLTETVSFTLPTFTDNSLNGTFSYADAQQINGFTKMGTHNNHTYYISNTSNLYTNFITIVSSINAAYPVTINSEAENNFISNYLQTNSIASAYIGFSDVVEEGNFVWENGEAVTYTNWNANEPNNFGTGEDFTIMFSNGGWNDVPNNNYRMIIEVPFITEQTAGLASGEAFPAGSTTNTFMVNDGSGNTVTCSFDVIVATAPSIESQPSLVVLNSIPQNVDLNQLNVTASDLDGDTVTLSSSLVAYDCDNVSILQNSARYGNGASNTLGAGNVQTFKSNNNGFLTKLEVELIASSTAITQAVFEIYQNNNANPSLATDVELLGTVTLDIPIAGFSALGEGTFERPIYLEEDRMYALRKVSGPGIRMRQGSFYTPGVTFNHNFDNPLVVTESSGFNNDWRFFVTQFSTDDASPVQVPVTATDGTNNTNANVEVYHLSEILPTVGTQNISVFLDPSGNASITPEQVDNGSAAVCDSNLSLSLDISDFSCNDIPIASSSVSLNFEGNGHIQVDGSAPLDFGGSKGFTFETQIYPRSNANTYILSKTLGGASWPTKLTTMFYINANNQLVFGINRFSAGGWTFLNSPQNSISLNEWQHVAISYSPSTSTMKIYIEGIEVASATLNTSNPTASPGLLRIGASENGGGQFDGYMDNFRAWENELDAAEVLAVKNNNLSSVNNTLLLHYDFNTNFGIESVDISGTGRNGEFIGGLSESSWYSGVNSIKTGGVTVTLTATDDYGNVASGTAIVTLLDNLAPGVSASPDNVLEYTTNPLGLEVNYTLPLSTDNCSAPQSLDNYPPTPTNYSKLGVFNGHTYFISDQSYEDIQDHLDDIELIANAYPVAVNTPAENAFIASKITELGFSNVLLGAVRNSPTEFEWINGEPFTYTNWNPGEPNNSGGVEDKIEINGSLWNDAGATPLARRIIIEFPFAIEQASGFASGEVFPPGITTNEFVVYDKSGNSTDFSFDVNVRQADYVYLNDAWLDAKNPDGNAVSTESMLVVDNSATLLTPVSLAEVSIDNNAALQVNDVLSITTSIINNGEINFNSASNKTAQFDEFTGSYAGSGSVQVERYIPQGKRAFRLLSSAVTTTTSIYENWQENGASPVGFGTHITGVGGTNNGFDATTTNNSSFFTFDNSVENQSGGAAWQAVANTDLNTLSAGTPYRLFVRGDRNVDLTSNESNATATTLRATGSLNIGDYSPSISAHDGNYNFVGNPYQATVDFNQLTFSGDINTDYIYVWDPQLGSESVGGFVTITSADGSNLLSSNANEFIQPGQAFFVRNNLSVNTAPNITFTEASKDVTEEQLSTFSTPNYTKLNLQLFSATDDGEEIVDAIGLRFSENFQNEINDADAGKMGNTGENLALVNSNQLFSIEQRETPIENEEIQLFANNYQNENYSFKLQLENANEDLEVYIKDNYLETLTPIDTENEFSFSVDPSISESTSILRFSLVFGNETLSDIDFNKENYTVYPNPTTDAIFIKGLSTQAEIWVYDVLGKKVLQTKVKNADEAIDLHQLEVGVYLVKVEGETYHFTQKIIKK